MKLKLLCIRVCTRAAPAPHPPPMARTMPPPEKKNPGTQSPKAAKVRHALCTHTLHRHDMHAAGVLRLAVSWLALKHL